MKMSNIFIKIKEKMQFLYKKNKRLFFVFIFIVLIAIALIYPKTNNSSVSKHSDMNINSSLNLTFEDALEFKLENMLNSISSVSVARVMVVVESSEIKNYLSQSESTKNTTSSGESVVEKEEIVYEKNGSYQSPVVVSTIYPKIKGVLIVLNKIDPSTKVSIKNAVAGVLNIDSNSIFILQDR